MSKGVYKIETEVFHFPEYKDNGVTGWYIPHPKVDHPVGGPSLTRQDMAEECDINNIMAKYEATGYLPSVNGREPYYADFTAMPTDLRGAMDLMRDAEEAFMSLPAKVRKEFDNDAALFADFAADPEHREFLVQHGLAERAAPATPEVAPGAAAPAPATTSAPAPAAPAVPPAAAG